MKGNLFDSEYLADPNTMVMHCISSDYALGKGFAAEIERRYHIRNYLKTVGDNTYPTIIPVNNILNLVTKDKYYNKPTYETLRATLLLAQDFCHTNGITRLLMPKIGCGLDRLDWSIVREDIKYILDEFDIDCIVYSL